MKEPMNTTKTELLEEFDNDGAMEDLLDSYPEIHEYTRQLFIQSLDRYRDSVRNEIEKDMTKPITDEQVARFEYLVKNHTSWIDAETDRFNGDWFQDRLDKFGKKGWELCAVDDIHVYFKRELRASIKELGENK